MDKKEEFLKIMNFRHAGYRINEQSEQLRLSFEDVVEFIR